MNTKLFNVISTKGKRNTTEYSMGFYKVHGLNRDYEWNFRDSIAFISECIMQTKKDWTLKIEGGIAYLTPKLKKQGIKFEQTSEHHLIIELTQKDSKKYLKKLTNIMENIPETEFEEIAHQRFPNTYF